MDLKMLKFIMQEKELYSWLKTMSLPPRLQWPMVAVDSTDVVRAVELLNEGRVQLIDGDWEKVLPGIDFIRGV